MTDNGINRELLAAAAEQYGDWQRNVTWDDGDRRSTIEERKVREQQENLVTATEIGCTATAQYLISAVPLAAELLGSIRQLSTTRTVDEMKRPPILVERDWYADLSSSPLVDAVSQSNSHGPELKQLDRTLAAQPVFWYAAHAMWIGRERFEPTPFAVFCEIRGTQGVSERGRLEACTRNFLRRTSGLPLARGASSVLSDCLVARGFWRTQIAMEVSETLVAERTLPVGDYRRGAQRGVPELTAMDCHRLLHSNGLWARLVELSVRRVASVNAPRARAALLAALHQADELGVRVTAKAVQGAIVELGRVASGFNLHHACWDRLVDAAVSGLEAGATQLDDLTDVVDDDELDPDDD